MELDDLIVMKHVCKFCHKRFPCGRSLGGHMRSHMITNPTDHESNFKQKVNNSIDIKNKKPWSQIKCCKECGKAFQSSKALSGHMKSHAVFRRQRYTTNDVITTSNYATSSSDYNNNEGSSSISEINEHEQEEVAMCLIMLSKDMGPWGRAGTDLSDNNSVFSEPNARTRVVDETGGKRGTTSKDLVAFGYQKNNEKRKAKCDQGLLDSCEKRSKFECTTCNKTFHSYQALGGHRASHKKTKGCSLSKPDGTHIGDNEEIPQVSVHMTQKHECPICYKEFPSGQALGGHKRSHLMAINVHEKSNTTTTTSSSHEVRDFLDLNLPALVEEETSNDLVGFNPWWVQNTHKHQQFVGLISN